jgi:hypothetical protein
MNSNFFQELCTHFQKTTEGRPEKGHANPGDVTEGVANAGDVKNNHENGK